MKIKTRSDLIPDAKIIAVHGNAHFGDIGERKVVDRSVIKTAAEFDLGQTASEILIEHGLAVWRGRNKHQYPNHLRLTAFGRVYLAAVLREEWDVWGK